MEGKRGKRRAGRRTTSFFEAKKPEIEEKNSKKRNRNHLLRLSPRRRLRDGARAGPERGPCRRVQGARRRVSSFLPFSLPSSFAFVSSLSFFFFFLFFFSQKKKRKKKLTQIALTDPLVLRGMLALRPANVAVLGGGVPRLEAARARARAEWSKPPDGKRRGGGRENHNNNDGALGTGPTLYEKARAAAWPRAGAGASATAPAAVVGGAAAAPAAAAPAAPVVAAPPPPPPAQQQQQPPPPVSAAAPPAVIVLDSSDDEDVKMEPANEGGGGGERGEREEEPPSPSPPSFFPLPAAAGPAPSSWPRHPLSEAATATATATTKCLVRGRVVQATSSLKFMDPATGEALPEFGLEVELEESARGGGSGGGSGGNGSGGSGGSGEEEEGFAPLTRRPAALSHALVSGLLGGISPRDLVEEYAREGGREALLGKLGRVKEFFDGFDGLLGVEARKKEEEENAPSTATAAAPAAASLVVVGWWEA